MEKEHLERSQAWSLFFEEHEDLVPLAGVCNQLSTTPQALASLGNLLIGTLNKSFPAEINRIMLGNLAHALFSLPKGSPQVLPSGPYTGLLELVDDENGTEIKTIDGLKSTPWKVSRSVLCDKIIDAVNRYGRLLVRAPYASGKTSLAQLLQKRLKKDHKSYLVALLNVNSRRWETFWVHETGMNWSTVASSKEKVFIILDEIQLAYQKESSLWQIIKGLANSNPNVCWICVGAYGNPSGFASVPIDFATTISFVPNDDLPGMQYTREEFLELIEAFENEVGYKIENKSANYLFYITNGYPGLIGWLLIQAYHFFKNKKDEVPEQFFLFLHSAKLLNSLKSDVCRAIPDFWAHKESIKDVCEFILSKPLAFVRKDSIPTTLIPQLESCLKAGIIIDDAGAVSFATPLIRAKALSYFLGDPLAKRPATLCEFIIAVVRRLSAHQLCNENGNTTAQCKSSDATSRLFEARRKSSGAAYRSVEHCENCQINCERSDTEMRCKKGGDDTSRLTDEQCKSGDATYGLELQWQEGFYRSAASILPTNVIMLPECEREQGVGQEDVYIAEYKWMIEVLWDGKDEKRYEARGQYAPLVREAEAWAVIDFQGKENKRDFRRGAHPNAYHISFGNNFSTATIRGPHGARTVAILEDKVCDMIPN